jgi:hypothetical protein
MDEMARRLRETVGGKEAHDYKRQNGRNGGVQTHHDFGGAERQSIFYTKGWARRRVSDQVGSVYLSINSPAEIRNDLCRLAGSEALGLPFYFFESFV